MCPKKKKEMLTLCIRLVNIKTDLFTLHDSHKEFLRFNHIRQKRREKKKNSITPSVRTERGKNVEPGRYKNSLKRRNSAKLSTGVRFTLFPILKVNVKTIEPFQVDRECIEKWESTIAPGVNEFIVRFMIGRHFQCGMANRLGHIPAWLVSRIWTDFCGKEKTGKYNVINQDSGL